MQPQTDAELTAWNAGADMARTWGGVAAGHADPVRHLHTHMTTERIAALQLLGAETFWRWADLGYWSTLNHRTPQH